MRYASGVKLAVPSAVGHAQARRCASSTGTGLGELTDAAARVRAQVDCEGPKVLLTASWGRVLRDVLTHALRNSLDHGIENPAVRQTRRKPAAGHIWLRAERTPEGLRLSLSDDGNGLRLDVLRARANAPLSNDEDAASQVFLPGVTTAVRATSISGRGVGMDAIRAIVRREGGDVQIAFTEPAREGSRPFALVFLLPSSALFRAPRESQSPPALQTVEARTTVAQ
jgi:signal transduction histidine kinase